MTEIIGPRNLEGKLRTPYKTKAGIVITHSWRNDMYEFVCDEAAEIFLKNGYAVLSFDLTGHGESEGKLRDVSYEIVREDIDSAVNHLKKYSCVEKIFGYGISLGSAGITFSNEDISGQVLLSPRVVISPDGLYKRYKSQISKTELQEKGYVVMNSFSGRGDFEMGENWINEMRNQNKFWKSKYFENSRPTLIIQGTADEFYDKKLFRDFLDKSGSDYLEINGADHNFSNKAHRDFLINSSLSWFNSHL